MKTRYFGLLLLVIAFSVVTFSLKSVAAGLPPQAADEAFEHAASHIPVCPGPANKDDVRCHAHVVTDKSGGPSAKNAPSGYGPTQLHAYTSLTSAPNKQIIAIVDAYDHPSIQN